MRQTGAYPVVYMFVVTAAFSSVVIGLSAMTRERVQANARQALEAAVLRALPVEGTGTQPLRGPEIHQRFTELVRPPDDSSGGAYTIKKDGQIIAYAVPFEGKGFWATIRGIIGVAADKRTVTGIAFYEQSETPGLGAEITKPAFRNQFKDKTFAQDERPIAMRRPGATLGENDVYAVTGATQTSVRVESMINQAVRDWRAKVGGEGGSL